MPLQVDAVYENGALRPLQPSDNGARTRTRERRQNCGGRSILAVEYIERIKREHQDAEPAFGLKEGPFSVFSSP
jgi:predicted DNA-binding antitoxin AbrB/MazE fold protein